MYIDRAQHVHMKTVTLTELRRNIFRLVDEALATGEPIIVHRNGRRVVLREDSASPDVVETEEARAERWRKFWAEPPPPGWEDVDLSPADIRKARAEYWHWDGEPELDQ
jgi:antitoxin (DNA-binding transcriptional repressor) of toxin-antitoxin stability system